MKVRIGHVFGIGLYIHASLLLLLVGLTAVVYLKSGQWGTTAEVMAMVLAVFGTVVQLC